MGRRPVHKSLGHSVTAGAFDRHLSPQSERQHDGMGEDRLCSCAQTVEMTTAVENIRSSEAEVSRLILVFISMVAMVIPIKI